MTTYAWVAEHDGTGEQFGGTVDAEFTETEERGVTMRDYRPVFEAARKEAVARHGEDVFIAEIVWGETSA